MERIDRLRSIHEALRHALLSVDLESGRVEFADTDGLLDRSGAETDPALGRLLGADRRR